MFRSNAEGTMSGQLPTNYYQLSFREKLKVRLDQTPEGSPSRKLRSFLLLAVSFVTHTYCCLHLLVPYMVEDHRPDTRYYLRVAVCFVLTNTVANWLCFQLYDSSFKQTKDNPEYELGPLYSNNPDQFVSRIEMMNQEDIGYGVSSWNYCNSCKFHVPPRAYHCKICKKCILKRDHHCFIVGNCIGFRNQRYFIVFLFYCVVNSVIAVPPTLSYISHNLTSLAFYDYLLPVTLVRGLLGYLDLASVLLIYNSYVYVLLGGLCMAFLTTQLSTVVYGLTPYELGRTNVVCTRPISDNFRSVFGDFWALNFIFPAQILFKQPGNGKSWDGIKIIRTIKKTDPFAMRTK